jgi:hypothetical protein
MSSIYAVFERFKLGIPKRYLLLVAGSAWLFASIMLFNKGLSISEIGLDKNWLKIGMCVVLGVLFFLTLFSKISNKHIRRIILLENERSCLFSFFNLKSYILMAIMISFGVYLRKSGYIPMNYLSLFYFIMGTPLFLSAIKFYYYGINYSNALLKYS